MHIETLRVKNYRALHDLKLTDIPRFAVFVGANGSGKSTLFDVFGFLKACLLGNVRSALQTRGGFHEVLTRDAAEEAITFDLQFRMPVASVDRLVTYHLKIGLHNGRPVVAREILRYKRGRYGKPYHFLDFSLGEGYAITNEEDFNKQDEELDREDQTLSSPELLAIKGLGQFERFKAANAFRELLENWHVSDFHINLARGNKDAEYAEHLSETGDNLPQVAQYLFDEHREKFDRILSIMKRRVPGLEDIEAASTVDGRLVLRFRDGAFKDPFIDRYVSDGTIKMFAYLVLLYDPHPHPLLCVEEPENQLYPTLMQELAEEFMEYSRHGQVFVSTHSPDFVNGVPLEGLYWLVKEKGLTQVRRAKEDVQIRALVDEGDLPGYLWKQGLLTGAGPQ